MAANERESDGRHRRQGRVGVPLQPPSSRRDGSARKAAADRAPSAASGGNVEIGVNGRDGASRTNGHTNGTSNGNGNGNSNGNGNGGNNGIAGRSQAWNVRESIIDTSAYPVLTEQVQISQPPGGGPGAGDGSAGYGQTVNGALRDVLGWQPRSDDPKGFIGALTQSFALRDVEGHVEWNWTPRSYAVQTDLAGGITGAQASLLTRAKQAVDASLPLLDGLYPLNVEADPQDSEALRAMVRRQLTELVNELGTLGGPRVTRLDEIFSILLGPKAGATVLARALDGQNPYADEAGAGPAAGAERGEPLPPSPAGDYSPRPTVRPLATDVHIVLRNPEGVGGTLGALRRVFGLDSAKLVNTIDEEQNLTNFRILADYVVGLERSWLENRAFFTRSGGKVPFFGTQLVLLSRQLSVISESVNEVRFALDSVFIGPLERQTLLVVPRVFASRASADFDQPPPNLELARAHQRLDVKEGQVVVVARDVKWWVHVHPELFIEELLSWIESFASSEGPEVIRSGGKLGVQQIVTPTARRLYELTTGMLTPQNHAQIPDGFFTPRVWRAFHELAGQLFQLVELAKNIKHRTPADPE